MKKEGSHNASTGKFHQDPGKEANVLRCRKLIVVGTAVDARFISDVMYVKETMRHRKLSEKAKLPMTPPR